MRRPGRIKIQLTPELSALNGCFFIPGTTIFAQPGENSSFVILDSVPAGLIQKIYYAIYGNATPPRPVRDSVSVVPGETVTVANLEWKYSKRIVLNTTASGADIAGNVTDFPVLVRLTTGNFDFGLAGSHGEDLRFTKSDASPLPYEIKRWDPVAGLAEVWVKVDTVFGDDSTQSLVMYWGNDTAAGNSNGAAVFDSASGFDGVWHLGETSGTGARDASHNGFTGTYRGGLPRGVPGPLGICQQIARPDSDYADMGDVLNPGLNDISVGIWVKPAAFGLQQALIAKSNGNGPSATYGYLLSIDLFNFPHFYFISGGTTWGDVGTFDVSSNLTITDSTLWHYVFVTVDRSDNSRCKMYVDGTDRTGTIRGDISLVAGVANALSLHVGTESDDNYSFKGEIGEATIAFTARSADWVKLSYMNQKDGDRLVEFDTK